MLSVFGSNNHCEQLHNLMKNIKSITRMNLTDKHLERCMWITTAETEPVIGHNSSKVVQISQYWQILLKKIIEWCVNLFVIVS
jgi:hypothetical protein